MVKVIGPQLDILVSDLLAQHDRQLRYEEYYQTDLRVHMLDIIGV
jgi:hypothetical protein